MELALLRTGSFGQAEYWTSMAIVSAFRVLDRKDRQW